MTHAELLKAAGTIMDANYNPDPNPEPPVFSPSMESVLGKNPLGHGAPSSLPPAVEPPNPEVLAAQEPSKWDRWKNMVGGSNVAAYGLPIAGGLAAGAGIGYGANKLMGRKKKTKDEYLAEMLANGGEIEKGAGTPFDYLSEGIARGAKWGKGAVQAGAGTVMYPLYRGQQAIVEGVMGKNAPSAEAARAISDSWRKSRNAGGQDMIDYANPNISGFENNIKANINKQIPADQAPLLNGFSNYLDDNTSTGARIAVGGVAGKAVSAAKAAAPAIAGLTSAVGTANNYSKNLGKDVAVLSPEEKAQKARANALAALNMSEGEYSSFLANKQPASKVPQPGAPETMLASKPAPAPAPAQPTATPGVVASRPAPTVNATVKPAPAPTAGASADIPTFKQVAAPRATTPKPNIAMNTQQPKPGITAPKPIKKAGYKRAADVAPLVGKLFAARQTIHALHLRSKDYAEHVALDEFYTGILDLIDEFVEVYQGQYGLVEQAKSITVDTTADPVTYLKTLCGTIRKTREALGAEDTHLQNILDEMLGTSYRTIYKLENLGKGSKKAALLKAAGGLLTKQSGIGEGLGAAWDATRNTISDAGSYWGNKGRNAIEGASKGLQNAGYGAVKGVTNFGLRGLDKGLRAGANALYGKDDLPPVRQLPDVNITPNYTKPQYSTNTSGAQFGAGIDRGVNDLADQTIQGAQNLGERATTGALNKGYGAVQGATNFGLRMADKGIRAGADALYGKNDLPPVRQLPDIQLGTALRSMIPASVPNMIAAPMQAAPKPKGAKAALLKAAGGLLTKQAFGEGLGEAADATANYMRDLPWRWGNMLRRTGNAVTDTATNLKNNALPAIENTIGPRVASRYGKRFGGDGTWEPSPYSVQKTKTKRNLETNSTFFGDTGRAVDEWGAEKGRQVGDAMDYTVQGMRNVPRRLSNVGTDLGNVGRNIVPKMENVIVGGAAKRYGKRFGGDGSWDPVPYDVRPHTPLLEGAGYTNRPLGAYTGGGNAPAAADVMPSMQAPPLQNAQIGPAPGAQGGRPSYMPEDLGPQLTPEQRREQTLARVAAKSAPKPTTTAGTTGTTSTPPKPTSWGQTNYAEDLLGPKKPFGSAQPIAAPQNTPAAPTGWENIPTEARNKYQQNFDSGKTKLTQQQAMDHWNKNYAGNQAKQDNKMLSSWKPAMGSKPTNALAKAGSDLFAQNGLAAGYVGHLTGNEKRSCSNCGCKGMSAMPMPSSGKAKRYKPGKTKQANVLLNAGTHLFKRAVMMPGEEPQNPLDMAPQQPYNPINIAMPDMATGGAVGGSSYTDMASTAPVSTGGTGGSSGPMSSPETEHVPESFAPYAGEGPVAPAGPAMPGAPATAHGSPADSIAQFGKMQTEGVAGTPPKWNIDPAGDLGRGVAADDALKGSGVRDKAGNPVPQPVTPAGPLSRYHEQYRYYDSLENGTPEQRSDPAAANTAPGARPAPNIGRQGPVTQRGSVSSRGSTVTQRQQDNAAKMRDYYRRIEEEGNQIYTNIQAKQKRGVPLSPAEQSYADRRAQFGAGDAESKDINAFNKNRNADTAVIAQNGIADSLAANKPGVATTGTTSTPPAAPAPAPAAPAAGSPADSIAQFGKMKTDGIGGAPAAPMGPPAPPKPAAPAVAAKPKLPGPIG